MDYENKYKEALKAMKSLYNVVRYHSSSDALLTFQTLEKAFPELAESEDERIRKEIVYYLERSISPHDYVFATKSRAWIAWLEKQGEKESDPRYSIIDELIEADDIYQMSMNDAMVEEAKSKAISSLSKLSISELLGFEKQSEQKTAWSEEDEGIRKDIHHIIDVYWGNQSDKREEYHTWLEKQASIPHFTYDDILALQCAMKTIEKEDKLYEQLTSLHDRIHDAYYLEKQGNHNEQNFWEKCNHCEYFDGYDLCLHKMNFGAVTDELKENCRNNKLFIEKQDEQKPWSEEDEYTVNGLSDMLYNATSITDDTAEKYTDWLKSLKDRVQPQSKQEWNVQDEAFLGDAIYAAENTYSENCGQEELIDWLKSLKPQNHWKPSEEQMKALEKECFAHSSYQLCRLLEELEKL